MYLIVPSVGEEMIHICIWLSPLLVRKWSTYVLDCPLYWWGNDSHIMYCIVPFVGEEMINICIGLSPLLVRILRKWSTYVLDCPLCCWGNDSHMYWIVPFIGEKMIHILCIGFSPLLVMKWSTYVLDCLLYWWAFWGNDPQMYWIVPSMGKERIHICIGLSPLLERKWSTYLFDCPLCWWGNDPHLHWIVPSVGEEMIHICIGLSPLLVRKWSTFVLDCPLCWWGNDPDMYKLFPFVGEEIYWVYFYICIGLYPSIGEVCIYPETQVDVLPMCVKLISTAQSILPKYHSSVSSTQTLIMPATVSHFLHGILIGLRVYRAYRDVQSRRGWYPDRPTRLQSMQRCAIKKGQGGICRGKGGGTLPVTASWHPRHWLAASHPRQGYFLSHAQHPCEKLSPPLHMYLNFY